MGGGGGYLKVLPEGVTTHGYIYGTCALVSGVEKGVDRGGLRG